MAFFIETSAKTGQNVEEIFITAAKLLYSGYKDKIAVMVSIYIYILLFIIRSSYIIFFILYLIERTSSK